VRRPELLFYRKHGFTLDGITPYDNPIYTMLASLPLVLNADIIAPGGSTQGMHSKGTVQGVEVLI